MHALHGPTQEQGQITRQLDMTQRPLGRSGPVTPEVTSTVLLNPCTWMQSHSDAHNTQGQRLTHLSQHTNKGVALQHVQRHRNEDFMKEC